VSGNTVTVDSSLLTSGVSLFDFRGTLTGTNVLANNTLTMTGAVGGAVDGVHGVRVRGDVQNLTIDSNTLLGGNPGGAGSATLPASSGLFIDTDAIAAALDLDVRHNSLTGWTNGVSVFDTDPGAFGGLPVGATVALFGNDLSGNSGQGVQNGPGAMVDASANWWGTNSAAGVAAEAGANVDFTPWLGAGADTSAAVGFQGDFSKLHVDDDSPQTGLVARIAEGISLVALGGAVVAESGFYSENVDVNRAVTLQGNANIQGSLTASVAGAVIDPGNTVGQIIATDLSLVPGSTFSVDLNGDAAGTGYDQIRTSGAVNVDGSTLRVRLNYTPAVGKEFRIINRAGTARTNPGRFAGLAEGAVIRVRGMRLRISYHGGDGNDITLTRIS
jgi:hypothetical protein